MQTRLPGLVLVTLCFSSPTWAEKPKEPTFTITLEQWAGDAETWFEERIEGEFKLCPQWGASSVFVVGVDKNATPRGGALTPGELYAKRGSLLGLKPGERLQFYRHKVKGSGRDSTGATVSLYSVGDGLEQTLYKDKTGKYQDVNGDQPGDRPGSREVDAELIRTAKGARLAFNDYGSYTGGSGNFGMTSVALLDVADPERFDMLSFTLTEADLEKWDAVDLEKKRSGPAKNVPSYKLQRTMRLRVAPEEPGEVVIEIPEHDRWVPKGNLTDAAQPGNELTITAKVKRSEKSNEGSDKKVKLKFELVDVSSELGTCLNWPEKPGAAEKDLKLLKKAKNEKLSIAESNQEATTREAVKEVELVVSAFDYGAWGRLKITATDEEGKPVSVSYRGSQEPISIPLDDDENHIADAWEEQQGLRSKPGETDDESEPVGNGFPGDGLTLYEEYRGFAVQGAHRHAVPTKKDVFVCDETGRLEKGIALFETITDLKVHRLAKAEFPKSRVINAHHSAGPHVVDQHGVRIISGPSGLAVGVKGDDASVGPPKTVTYVQVPAAKSCEATGPNDERYVADRVTEVAHELCHAVGIDHHGDGNVGMYFWAWKQTSSGEWKLMEYDLVDTDADDKALQLKQAGAVQVHVIRESDLKEVQPTDNLERWARPIKHLNGYRVFLVTGKGGPQSGADRWFLRYEWFPYISAKNDTVRYLPNPAEWKLRNELCDASDGTGANAPDHVPESRSGPAQLGKCRRQLVVNDLFNPPGW